MSMNSLICRAATFAVLAAVAAGSCFAQAADVSAKTEEAKVVRVALNEDGSLTGRVFAMLDDEQAPMVAKVSLATDGKTVVSGETDVIGNFSFQDVEPGEYTMVGVSGEYVGDQVVVVTKKSEEATELEEGVYTSLALQVAPVGAYSDASFASVPMDAYASPAPVFGGGSCSTCGSGASACGGCGGGGGGGFGGGSSSLRRLLLVGGAVAIPLALIDNDDDVPVSADE